MHLHRADNLTLEVMQMWLCFAFVINKDRNFFLRYAFGSTQHLANTSTITYSSVSLLLH